MKTTAFIAIAGLASIASADVLLELDLSVVDQITISATNGLSAADASASAFTGFLMADFFNSASGSGAILNSGDLSTAGNASDNSPALWSSGSSFGLNVWGFSTDSTVGVTAGAQAFSGSATWAISAPEYAAMLAGNLSGDIYFGADTDDDIAAGAVLIGSYRVVPAPGSMALLGLGGIVAGRRRR